MKRAFYFLLLLILSTPSSSVAEGNFYPLNQGTKWTYVTQAGEEKVTQVTGFTQLRAGKNVVPAVALRRTDGRDRLIIRTRTQLIECGLIDADQAKVDCERPLVFFQWPIQKGDRWQGADLDFFVETKETVKVPAGTFQEAWRIAYAPSGELDPVGQVWMVKGIGPVRIFERQADYRLVRFEPGQGPDLTTVSEEEIAGVLANLPPSSSKIPRLLSNLFYYLTGEGWLWLLALLLTAACFGTASALILAIRKQQAEETTPVTAQNPEEASMVSAMIRTGNLDQALRDLQELIAKNPRYPDLHYQLAQVYKGNKAWEKARKSLEMALSLNPNYVEAQLDLGRVFMMEGKALEASQQFEKGAGKHPGYADLQLEWGRALETLGDQLGAVKALERALEINSHLAEARLLLEKCRESAQNRGGEASEPKTEPE